MTAIVQSGEIITVHGPVVVLFQPDWFVESRFSSDIVYSIQLANGAIITSPEKFPANALPNGS